jgi:hypothetical protein
LKKKKKKRKKKEKERRRRRREPCFEVDFFRTSLLNIEIKNQNFQLLSLCSV